MHECERKSEVKNDCTVWDLHYWKDRVIIY